MIQAGLNPRVGPGSSGPPTVFACLDRNKIRSSAAPSPSPAGGGLVVDTIDGVVGSVDNSVVGVKCDDDGAPLVLDAAAEVYGISVS